MDREASRAFRTLWRAARQVFANDASARQEAGVRIRSAFRNNKTRPQSKERAEEYQVAEDTAALLKQTVVQAKYNPDRNLYKAKFEERHVPSATPEPVHEKD